MVNFVTLYVMNQYFEFFSETEILPFNIKMENHTVENVDYCRTFLHDLFGDISDFRDGSYHFEPYFQNISEVREHFYKFVEKYKERHENLNSIAAFFRRMEEGQHFLFFAQKFDELTKLRFRATIEALRTGKDYHEIIKPIEEQYAHTAVKYTANTHGPWRHNIGEFDQKLRVCRFCKNERVQMKWDRKAHAMAESFGNKTVRLFEECDDCNEGFGKSIEWELSEAFSFIRAFHRIQGKNGTIDAKGNNYSLVYDEKEERFRFSVNVEKPTAEGDNPGPYTLFTNEEVVRQNLYRVFCKFFLSVIDSAHLNRFEETRRWVRGEFSAKALPLICEMNNNDVLQQPVLRTYIRNDDDKSLPYAVCDFSFASLKCIFIVPTFDDENDFTDVGDFNRYWDFFKLYSGRMETLYVDYSSIKPALFPFRINLAAQSIVKLED